jgi:hypothetical protein
MFATSLEVPKFTVKEAPLWAIRIPLTRQPPASARTHPLVAFAKGQLVENVGNESVPVVKA